MRRIGRTLGVPVYFCDCRSPWQQGSNEIMNGQPRDYPPMGACRGSLVGLRAERVARPTRCDWTGAGVIVDGLCSDSRLELKLPLNAALHVHDACAAKTLLT